MAENSRWPVCELCFSLRGAKWPVCELCFYLRGAKWPVRELCLSVIPVVSGVDVRWIGHCSSV